MAKCRLCTTIRYENQMAENLIRKRKKKTHPNKQEFTCNAVNRSCFPYVIKKISQYYVHTCSTIISGALDHCLISNTHKKKIGEKILISPYQKYLSNRSHLFLISDVVQCYFFMLLSCSTAICLTKKSAFIKHVWYSDNKVTVNPQDEKLFTSGLFF